MCSMVALAHTISVAIPTLGRALQCHEGGVDGCLAAITRYKYILHYRIGLGKTMTQEGWKMLGGSLVDYAVGNVVNE